MAATLQNFCNLEKFQRSRKISETLKKFRNFEILATLKNFSNFAYFEQFWKILATLQILSNFEKF